MRKFRLPLTLLLLLDFRMWISIFFLANLWLLSRCCCSYAIHSKICRAQGFIQHSIWEQAQLLCMAVWEGDNNNNNSAEEENRSSCYKYAAYFWALHNLGNKSQREKERESEWKGQQPQVTLSQSSFVSCINYATAAPSLGVCVCECDVICVEKWVRFFFRIRFVSFCIALHEINTHTHTDRTSRYPVIWVKWLALSCSFYNKSSFFAGYTLVD